jgi:predicted DNA-binding transcriptional regulator YafY
VTSPKTATRLSRILAMLPWVIAHPGATVDEVCERFGYDRRRLIEDLELVFMCGLPGYGPGDLMVAYVEGDRVVVDTADYFAGAPRLTSSEALGLLAAGMAVAGAGHGGPALESAVAKLSAALLPDAGEVLAVDLAAEPDLVSRLREAAASGRMVRITYTALATGVTSVRDVEPWAVFSSLGNWYLSGHCRKAGGERVFRVDRIRAVETLDERFEPPGQVPAPEIRYTPSEDDVRATIALGPAARWVAEYYPVEVASDDGETLVVTFSAYDPAVAAGLLLRLGPNASLVEGQEVDEALSRLRDDVLRRYGEGV